MTAAKWLPVEGGVVPQGDSSGPLQEEEHFAALERALEDARGEHRLRRLDAAAAILDMVIPAAESFQEYRYSLLVASAYSLKGRIHWRRGEQGLEHGDEALVKKERAKQEAAFRKAIKLFKKYKNFIAADMPESRLYTDVAIALFRTDNNDAAIDMLQRAQATGVMPAAAFAYLGLAYLKRNDFKESMLALKKGLQLAPGDKVLLETLAETFEKTGESDKALRTYCKAAIAAGKDDDLVTAQRLLRTALKIKPDDAQALCMLTLLLRSQGKDTAAKDLLDATLKTFETNVWALGLRAVILRDQGFTEAALSDFRQVHVDSADLAWVLLEYAKTVGASDQTFARKLLREAARFLGKDDARVAQAKVQLQVQIALAGVAGMSRKVVDLLRIAASRVASTPFVRSVVDQAGLTELFGRLLMFADNEPEQAALLEKIVKDWPDRAEPREALARVLLGQKQYEKAIKQIDEALRDAPYSPDLLGLKAEALDQKGEITEAVRFYRRACRAAPEDDEVFGRLVDALTRANRSHEALSEVEHKLALFPTNGPALTQKGRLLWKRDRYGEALETFERAARDDNKLADAHAYLAAMLFEIADYDRAAAVTERAISRILADASDEMSKTRLAWLWSNRGWALRYAGMTPVDQLKPMFEKATTLAPHDPYAKMRLGWAILNEPGGQGDGERLIRELIEDRAGIHVPKELVGWCYFMLKEYEEAEHWLRSVVFCDPSDITTRFDLALALLAMDRDDAEMEFSDAIERARKKAPERQRGLFHVAIVYLIAASKEGCVDHTRARSVWQDLWNNLKAAGLRHDELARLQYPAAEEGGGLAYRPIRLEHD